MVDGDSRAAQETTHLAAKALRRYIDRTPTDEVSHRPMLGSRKGCAQAETECLSNGCHPPLVPTQPVALVAIDAITPTTTSAMTTSAMATASAAVVILLNLFYSPAPLPFATAVVTAVAYSASFSWTRCRP